MVWAMKRAIPSMVACLFAAGFVAALMADPRDTLVETVAKGIGVLAMLLLALSVARDAERSIDPTRD